MHPRWRAKAPRRHRQAGTVALVSGLATAMTGGCMAMAQAIPESPQGLFRRVTRLPVGGGMFVRVRLALRAMVQRRFDAHGACMLRAHALGLGAGTQALVFLAAEPMLAEAVQGQPRDTLMAPA